MPSHSSLVSETNAFAGPVLPLDGEGLLALAGGVLGHNACLRFRARGGSMSPFVRDSDTVSIAPLDGPVRLGDVVAFQSAGRLLVHRVIRIGKDVTIAKGDNAAAPDPPAIPVELLGRVVRVERRGRRIFLGLGPERALIALMSRFGILSPCLRPLRYAFSLFKRHHAR